MNIKSTYIDSLMNTNEIKTYRLIIKGKVQGVGFRHWFSDLAISLGLNGYVQNKEGKKLLFREICKVFYLLQKNQKMVLHLL